VFNAEDKSSKGQANNRLRLVLTHDRLGTSGLVMEAMKEEIIQVIAKHMEIEGVPEVKIITEGRHAAMDISIPLKGR
ncbi:MAG: cell division topological specificity factor MinE, partial [Syntrophomonadaceae bacterium]|nr:cell division topological specificity factor MinE [Syntrophomonadaceae bacterium]